MPRGWSSMPLPLFIGGEDSASAPLVSQEAARVENALLTGRGVVAQISDWRVSATADDGAGTESDAVCGIFPFAVKGTASAESAGVALSFDTSADKLYLHQLGEDDQILRTMDAILGYTEARPPQVTGFEMFSKFYFCPDARETTATRRGLHVFDPTGPTITQVVADVGGGSAALRFRGIAKHRGGTIIGWGYFDNTTPDKPHLLRYCRYGDPDTWVPDADPTTAGWIPVGTPGLPLTACAASGQVTILGKPTEIFALDGDYSEQFYYRPIGQAHGPLSGTGMVSTGPLAVWMSEQGPAMSANGGDVRLLATNRLTRRLETYYDLTWAWAVHDSPRTRVGWLLRRKTTLDGVALTANWADEILWWDYERDSFTIQGTPTTCFSIGTTAGGQLSLAAPVGTPASLTNSKQTSTTASFAWTHVGGDVLATVYFEYRVVGALDWIQRVLSPGTASYILTGLTALTNYNWRLRYFRNGTYGSPVSGPDFATLAPSTVATPANFAQTGQTNYTNKGTAYTTITFGWTNTELTTGAVTLFYQGTTAVFAAATVLQTLPLPTSAWTITEPDSTTPYYYWVRHRDSDGTLGDEVYLATNPVVYGLP